MAGQEAGSGGGKLKDLNRKAFGRATPRVQELTIDDLNKLAKVAGSTTGQASGAVAGLTADDLKSLDDAMHESRLQASDVLARRLKGGQEVSAEEQEIFDNWSCCCCTPCCCCAAADVDPFE
jgi:hypothetical protein